MRTHAARRQSLPVSMALGYGVTAFSGLDLGLDIATTVARHGSLNAFGFALCGVATVCSVASG